MGFKIFIGDSAFWYRLCDDESGYDYFSHHVDDFICSGENIKRWLEFLKHSYTVTGGEKPEFHLGMDIKSKHKKEKHKLIISSHSYLKEIILKIENTILKKKLIKKNFPI